MKSIHYPLPKVLVLGDAVVPTGFARVLHSIFAPMADRFEIHHIGVNYRGQEHDWPWTVYPTDQALDPFGCDLLEKMLKDLQPDLVFLLSDHDILCNWIKTVNAWKGRSQAKVVVYCPVDAAPLAPVFCFHLAQADRLVTFTEFGRESIREGFEKCKEKDPGFRPVAVEVMPHGVDHKTFHPMGGDVEQHLSPEGKRAAKRRLLQGDPALENSFIILNANRNQERKRQDITLRGFARFAAGKPENVMLYMHCGVKDLGWNLIELARREGISDRLILSTTQGLKPAFSDAELNSIYNACDVGINTCSAEGWGLVSFEHAATGAAQLVPNHTGCGELWNGHAEMMEPVMSITHRNDLTEQHLLSPRTVAETLERIYQDPAHLYEMSLAAFRNATQEAYDWHHISARWESLFQAELAAVPHSL